ncbi:MAG: molybdopterin-guanine dinucleotide biosynthesis protein B [Nitrososphaerota archaeon]|nr:molybdopterin-guanine dinucleotide biosynthesis protein B [Nitrososphaerales archaeon]MDW8045008.1 molybdopterin-guanine dinucleotide biosynthesis protein B [Nitrososphaerota archaeon]
MVRVIAVVGRSGSGKTTTIEFLISNLTAEGFKIGSIKHIHLPGFTIDKKGKDTWRHARAGARIVAALSPSEVVIIKKLSESKYGLEDLIRLFESEGLDVIILEGFHSLIANRGDVDKIIVAETEKDLNAILEGTVPPILAVTGRVSKKKRELSNLGFPILDLYKEGDRLYSIVKERLLKHEVR